MVSVIFLVAGLSGCSRIGSHAADQYVYVTAKQTFLRDRVAAVSNRTATVVNGDRLSVLDHGRRFFKVKTDKGDIGWIDERAVATQEIYDGFQRLHEEQKAAPEVATALVRDEVNLHLKAGRETEVLYRLPEGDKLSLLKRATLPKPAPGGGKAVTKPLAVGETPAPIPMEDWWMVRDQQGRTGWLLSRMLDVDVPDTVARYAEGQRFVGAYVLETVHDDDSGQDLKDIPQYLTLLVKPASGLPYDFDQVRVFSWNLKKHRYETAYREHNIEGYLPVTVTKAKDPYGKGALADMVLPTFTYKVLAADAPVPLPDPVTGVITPGKTISRTYRLEANLVRRIAPSGYHDDPAAHPVEETKDKAKAKAKGKRR